MPGLDPGIHAVIVPKALPMRETGATAWMPWSSHGMTEWEVMHLGTLRGHPRLDRGSIGTCIVGKGNGVCRDRRTSTEARLAGDVDWIPDQVGDDRRSKVPVNAQVGDPRTPSPPSASPVPATVLPRSPFPQSVR